MRNFYWLIDGALGGCSRPGVLEPERRGGSSPEVLENDLAWLRAQGIDALLSLTETPLPVDILTRHALTTLHLPITDMQAPTAAELRRALEFIDQQRAAGRRVVVHCLVGQGRTGTVLAAYLIRGGHSLTEALAAVRAVCPHAVENQRQERALADFAAERGWLI